jgi:TPR repeat protein
MRKISVALLAIFFGIYAAQSWSADLKKGIEAYSVGNYDAAIAEWQPLAENGNADGQFWLATLYANGMGVPQSDEIALKWFSLAADQDHGEAQYNIGLIHANGWGVPMDTDEALRWYKMAADNGFAEAQYSVADMYDGGWGREKDLVAAYMWLSLAAAQEHNEAQRRLKELQEEMTAADVAMGKERANTWMGKFETRQAKKDTAYAYQEAE